MTTAKQSSQGEAPDGTLVRDLLDRLPLDTASLVDRVVDPAQTMASFRITGARSLRLATASDVVFCKSASAALIDALASSPARCVVTTPDVYDALPEAVRGERAFVLTARPRVVISMLTTPLVPIQRWFTVDQAPSSVTIAADAELAPGVIVGEHVHIGARAVIGPNSVLSHVTIGEGSVIGPNCSIGGQGFGFETDPETGAVYKVPHFGRVTIGANVEIFANVCIARGSFDDTVIDDEVKIDNLVHIAHNCRIGRGAFVIANAMVAGSVVVGEASWIAPSTSILNGITVGRNAMTGLGAVVVKPVDDNTLVAGVPAKPLRPRVPPSTPA